MKTLTKSDRSSAGESVKVDFFLGGYDAKSCPTLVMKNHHPSYSDEDKDPIPAGDVSRMEEGVRFESEVGDLWKKALGDRLLVIPACDRSPRSKKLREKLTLAALKNPGDALVIWNARLPQNKRTRRTGEPDALVRWGVDAKGTHLWVPVDVKHHRSLEGSTKNTGSLVSQLGQPHPDDALVVDLGVGVPQRSDAFQLAHYVRMLESLGHAAPVSLAGIVGKELQIVWHRLDEKVYDYRKVSGFDLYDAEFASRVKIAQAALAGVELVGPEWKSECKSCVWRTSCHDQLKVDLDHITLIHGVTPDRAAKHYEVGVTQITELAQLDWRTARLVDLGVDVPGLLAWAAGSPATAPVTTAPLPGKFPREVLAELKLTAAQDVLRLDPRTAKYSSTGIKNLAISIDRARAMKVGKVFLARSCESVSIKRTVFEQDFDIESDQGYVYLIGVRTTGRKAESGQTPSEVHRTKNRFEFDAFVNWDRSEAGEARVFAEFWAHIAASREKAKRGQYGYRCYHFAAHERNSFKALAIRHAGKPGVPTLAEVEEFFDHRDVIDLHKVLSEQLIWPTESMTLKELAKWVRFSWRDSDPGGDNSLAWYRDAVDHPDADVREENRKRILEYNEDDVTAQVALRDWLSRLGEARQPGKKLPGVGSLDRRFMRR